MGTRRIGCNNLWSILRYYWVFRLLQRALCFGPDPRLHEARIPAGRVIAVPLAPVGVRDPILEGDALMVPDFGTSRLSWEPAG